MNRKQAKEAGEILIAYSEGKIIEYKDTWEGEWLSASSKDNLYFNWNTKYYRIKPEQKLVPFTYEDNELFLGKVVIHKDSPYRSLIIACYSRDVVLSNGACDYDRLLKEYVFKDGSQCGKIIYE